MKDEELRKRIERRYMEKAKEIRRRRKEEGIKLKEGWECILWKRVEEQVIKEEKASRNKFIAALTAAGLAISIGGAACEDERKTTEPEVQHETEMETQATEIREYSLIEDILKEYNEKNPEIEISMDEVGILKEAYSQYVYEEEGIYKENCRDTNGNPLIDEDEAQGIYTLLDKQNQKVICAVGNIKYELSYVEVQEIRTSSNTPYYGDAEEMVWVEQDNLAQLREECEELLQEKIQEQKEQEKEDEER